MSEPPQPSWQGGPPPAPTPPPPAPTPPAPAPGCPGQPFPSPVPPRKKGGAGKIALIIGGIILVLLCACGGVVVWGLNQAGDEIEKAIDALPSIDPTASDPTASPATGANGGEDFGKGDCVINEGTDSDAKLKKVPCGAGTFEVVAEIPLTTDRTQCDNEFLGAGKDNWDSAYTYDEKSGDLGDYVLCLKQR